MATIEEQIEEIQEEIRKTPYHKGTEHHIGKLRARIARLKDKTIESQSKGGGGGGGGYAVKKHGDATVVLIGPPSAGKSTLINRLTHAQSRVASYAFTTVSVIPGMMEYKNARIQILDVPGLIEGAEEGRGRGREVLSVTRGANLIVIMTDIQRIHALESLEKALERNGIRINTKSPDVKIEKKVQGGLNVVSNIKQDISKETIKEIVREMGIKNADISINEKITIDRLIDSLSVNRVYIPAIYVVNKVDGEKDNHKLQKVNLGKNILGISAEKGVNLEIFKDRIWEALNFTQIFLVGENEEPSNDHPMIVKRGALLKDIALKIGTNFAENKKAARIWGSKAKFPGQEVSLQTKTEEDMQVRFV